MRGKADLPIRKQQPGVMAHLPIKPGIRFCGFWPDAFVQAAKDHQIGALHPSL